jgi:hypothetical protein
MPGATEHQQGMFPSSDLKFRAGIALVAAATLFVGLAIWRLWPEPAEKEFARAAEALKAVHSFRYEYSDLGPARPNRQTREIACPSRQRITIASASGDYGTFDYIYVEGRSFHSTPQTGGWNEYINEIPFDLGLDPRTLCDKIASGQDTGPFPLYRTLLKRGFPERGAIKSVEGGGECREWKVQVPRMSTQDDSESFCLDTKSYLPAYRLTASGRYSFSAFNTPLTIDIPRVTGMTY